MRRDGRRRGGGDGWRKGERRGGGEAATRGGAATATHPVKLRKVAQKGMSAFDHAEMPLQMAAIACSRTPKRM